MEKPGISFFAISFVLLFAVIGLIFAVFELHRLVFVLELMILLAFIFLFAAALFAVYRNKKFGWTMIGAALILLLLDALFIYLITKTFETAHMTIVFFSVIGLLVALLNLMADKKPHGSPAGYEKAKEYYQYIDKMQPEEELAHEKEPRIEKTFTPGKFVASRNASRFHSPKCDWAKRISKSNQLWFESEEEAKAKGFQADKCVG